MPLGERGWFYLSQRVQGGLRKEISRCRELQRAQWRWQVEGRSLEPGEGPGDTTGAHCLFQKQPQQYFCSHVFFEDLVTPHQQVAPISSLLELK